jgi:hypothetical protein
VRALARWQEVAGITTGPVFRRIWLPRLVRAGEPPPLPRMGTAAITPWAVAEIVKTRAVQAGFGARDFGGHSLKRGALTTGMERGVHPADLKRLGRHKSFDVLGEYLEFGDLFARHPLGACCSQWSAFGSARRCVAWEPGLGRSEKKGFGRRWCQDRRR